LEKLPSRTGQIVGGQATDNKSLTRFLDLPLVISDGNTIAHCARKETKDKKYWR
jgi:hypothetical protein